MIEFIQKNTIPFCLGVILTVPATYKVVTYFDSNELKNYQNSATREQVACSEELTQLQRKVERLKADNNYLKEEINENAVCCDLESIISNIDKEISRKKEQLAAASTSAVISSNKTDEQIEQSNSYQLILKELEQLQKQRNTARTKAN